jgi:UDP-N-acetylglucosamine enolpyruvyl transferase
MINIRIIKIICNKSALHLKSFVAIQEKVLETRLLVVTELERLTSELEIQVFIYCKRMRKLNFIQ